MPNYPKARPDFQATGPRVLIERDVNFEEEDLSTSSDEDDEVNEVANSGPLKLRYYESHQVLGKLYRAIDEQKFFEAIQRQSRSSRIDSGHTGSLADAVWTYVREKTALIQWRHYVTWAQDVRDK